MKKKHLLLAIPAILVVAIIASILKARSGPDEMTFEATIPANTLPGDTVYIYFHEGVKYKMQPNADLVYTITVPRQSLHLDDNIVEYRYGRNGEPFATAEYLEPDTRDYFFEKLGRSTQYAPGKVQKDTINQWRWYPPGNVPIDNKSSLEPIGNFAPRLNSIPFRSGQVIEDLYLSSYDEFFAPTAAHMREMGYRWVEFDPAWQWTEVDGMPKVQNLSKDSPNYASDEKFLEELRAFKAAGLKIVIQPQICCTALSTENRSAEWWDTYFAETQKFILHFAKLGNLVESDAMHYAVGSWEIQHIDKWREIFAALQQNFHGEIGQMVWNFGDEPGQIIPAANEIAWGDLLDYFYVAVDTPISTKSNPTDGELKSGADKMLDGAKSLYDRFAKPVMIRTTYFAVQETWRGSSYYSISDVPWIIATREDLEKSKYKQSQQDHARVINAYMQSIAERPWIIGYAQFGYTHWVNPLSLELSVRGKQAEDIWRKWNLTIYTAN